MNFDWNDLRVLAAVLEAGSTARAARALGVDQTTCARRVTALEAALGVELFVRDTTGYRPTPACLALQPAVQAVAGAVERFAQEAEGATRRIGRRLRVTAEDYVTRTRLLPALSRFAADFPDVQVEVDVSSQFRDLAGGEADIAVRAGPPPVTPTLVRRKLREDHWGVYCSAAYAAAHGSPTNLAEAASHPIVTLEAALDRVRAVGLERAVRQTVNSLPNVLAAIEAGVGVGAMPGIVAEGASDLQLCFELPDVSAIWLIYPEHLRSVTEVRTLTRLITEAFRTPVVAPALQAQSAAR